MPLKAFFSITAPFLAQYFKKKLVKLNKSSFQNYLSME